MAKVYENKKGFKVIQATRGEMICALSEYGCVGICDSCGSSNCQDGFYIAVFNRWYCSDCFHKWYARAKRYASDEYVENKNYPSSAPSASDSPKKNAEHCKLQVKVLPEMRTSTNR